MTPPADHKKLLKNVSDVDSLRLSGRTASMLQCLLFPHHNTTPSVSHSDTATTTEAVALGTHTPLEASIFSVRKAQTSVLQTISGSLSNVPQPEEATCVSNEIV